MDIPEPYRESLVNSFQSFSTHIQCVNMDFNDDGSPMEDSPNNHLIRGVTPFDDIPNVIHLSATDVQHALIRIDNARYPVQHCANIAKKLNAIIDLKSEEE